MAVRRRTQVTQQGVGRGEEGSRGDRGNGESREGAAQGDASSQQARAVDAAQVQPAEAHHDEVEAGAAQGDASGPGDSELSKRLVCVIFLCVKHVPARVWFFLFCVFGAARCLPAQKGKPLR
jgi:hypothetical protein